MLDYDSDFSDDCAEFTEEILNEFKENYEIKTVYLFKQYIIKEPEFYSINNISSVELIDMFKNPKYTTSNRKLTYYQHDLFNDLSAVILGKYESIEYYNNVFNMIYDRLYI